MRRSSPSGPNASRVEEAARLTLEFGAHAAIGLAKRNALGHHQAIGLLGGMYGVIELNPLRMKSERRDQKTGKELTNS